MSRWPCSDAQREHEIFQHFRELTQDRTAILISHRFSTVRMADRIAVLSDGAIVELGSHEQLIANQKGYAELFENAGERVPLTPA
jgi:ATP-binding cassette subfamily B protein